MSSKIENKKNQLLKASGEYEEELSKDFSIVAETATEWGGRILLIGGAMLLSYLGVRAIISKKQEETEISEQDTKTSRIEARNIFLKSLSDKAALVLLALIREYIVELLNDSSEEND
jgi:hypothetical protein